MHYGRVMISMKRINSWFVVVMTIALICGGCTEKANITDEIAAVPEHEAVVPEFKDAAKQPTSIQDVILGVGDQVEIKVFRNDSLTAQVTLNTSGVISLPLIGDVVFRNKGVIQLRKEIQQRYGEYIVNPQVFINILALNSQKVFVLGQVSSPGVINISTEMTIAEAIARAGSVTKDANSHEILLVRKNEKKVTVKKIDFIAIAQGGESGQDVSLQNRDIVFVPEKWLSVTASYMSYITQILSPIIALEGGLVLYPDVKNVFGGGTSDIQTSIPVGGQ